MTLSRIKRFQYWIAQRLAPHLMEQLRSNEQQMYMIHQSADYVQSQWEEAKRALERERAQRWKLSDQLNHAVMDKHLQEDAMLQMQAGLDARVGEVTQHLADLYHEQLVVNKKLLERLNGGVGRPGTLLARLKKTSLAAQAKPKRPRKPK